MTTETALSWDVDSQAEGARGEFITARAIVVGHDGSPGADRALDIAARLAGPLAASLLVARSWHRDPHPSAVAQLIRESRSTDEISATVRDELVADCSSVAREHAGLAIRYTAADASPAGLLCGLSRDALMLVVGSRGLNAFSGMMLGSVSNRCLHQSTRPVLVVPQRERHAAVDEHPSTPEQATTRTTTATRNNVSATPPLEPGSIVVGYDASPDARRALSEALRIAEQLAAPVAVIHTWSIDTAPRSSIWKDGFVASYPELAHEVLLRLKQHTKSLTKAHPAVAVECFAVLGHPAEALVRASETALMLVVGSRGLGGFGGLLVGSVSTHCVHRALCPVLVVPSGRHTPEPFVPAVRDKEVRISVAVGA
jgi:nucleotide-binding universal stress UspA family protein